MPYRQVGLICPSESVHALVDYLKKFDFDVRALWTPDADLTIQASAEHEIPFSASRPDEVLLKKEVQMIVITGRPQIHSAIAIKALGIGKHVLCDAPVTLNSLDASKMVQAAQYYPQLLALVGYGLRHLDVFRRARELITNGYIGIPIACECSVRTGSLLLADHYDWLWEYSMGGGVMNLVGCHVIDIISYLTHRRATRVQGLVKCSGLAAADGWGYSKEAIETDFLWMNGNEQTNPVEGSKKRSPMSNAGVGFRRVNAEDFASFLLKCDNDFVATVTLNALSQSMTSVGLSSSTGSNSAVPSSSRPYFHQRILISGTEGQLEIQDNELCGTKFRSASENKTSVSSHSANNGRHAALCSMELLYSDADSSGEVSAANAVAADDGLRLPHTVVPELYLRGFLNLLRLLAEASPAYEQQQRQSNPNPLRKQSGMDHAAHSWQTGCLSCLASFEDAQYVRAVIDAVRHSSEKGDWVKVDLRQHEDVAQRRMDRN